MEIASSLESMYEEPATSFSDTLLLRNLVAEEQRINRIAFEAIYERYSRRLVRYISDRVRSMDIAEDIVQEIFVSLWTRRSEANINGASLQHYLYQAARNKIFTYFRSEKIRKRYAENFTLFLMNKVEDSTNDWMDMKETKELVERILSNLPDRCQTAFKLSRFENRPIPEIAQHMKISSRTVENYLTQALKEMRLALTPSK